MQTISRRLSTIALMGNDLYQDRGLNEFFLCLFCVYFVIYLLLVRYFFCSVYRNCGEGK